MQAMQFGSGATVTAVTLGARTAIRSIATTRQVQQTFPAEVEILAIAFPELWTG
jgi:hypothetical protein